jgi:Fur family transcriptional regulator, peroxide stress response regulator
MNDPKTRFNEIVRKLRENNYKLTPQRLAITKLLSESKGHPSVEKIHDSLKKDFPTISLATVYRTVMTIKSLGEVLELGFADGSNRYDGNKPDPHPHLVCIKCRKIIDPDLSSLQDMTKEVAEETGFTIISHRLDFFGICPSCR